MPSLRPKSRQSIVQSEDDKMSGSRRSSCEVQPSTTLSKIQQNPMNHFHYRGSTCPRGCQVLPSLGSIGISSFGMQYIQTVGYAASYLDFRTQAALVLMYQIPAHIHNDFKQKITQEHFLFIPPEEKGHHSNQYHEQRHNRMLWTPLELARAA